MKALREFVKYSNVDPDSRLYKDAIAELEASETRRSFEITHFIGALLYLTGAFAMMYSAYILHSGGYFLAGVLATGVAFVGIYGSCKEIEEMTNA